MNFGEALNLMQDGHAVTRAAWDGQTQYVKLIGCHSCAPMNVPYFCVKNEYGLLEPWFASQSDLLAIDWVIYPWRVDGTHGKTK